MKTAYANQLLLLLKCLREIVGVNEFALKGGTAINLFLRDDFPRMSVDIDLVYIPIQRRDESLTRIEKGLEIIAERLKSQLPGIKITPFINQEMKTITRLNIGLNGTLIKIEVNPVIRGTIFPVEIKDLSDKISDKYGIAVLDLQVASAADIYGSKICAALDRQHPRDLFDIKILLETQGITEEIRKSFIAYLCSHKRPINEILNPNYLEQKQVYEQEFLGMSHIETSYEDLILVREKLVKLINSSLTEDEKDFLLSLKNGEPDWDKSGIIGLEKLPSIQWKLLNIGSMSLDKKAQGVVKLKEILYR